MLVVLVTLAVGIVLLLVGIGKIAHVGEMVSTVSIGVSFGVLLFSICYFAFGRKRRPATGKPLPERTVAERPPSGPPAGSPAGSAGGKTGS